MLFNREIIKREKMHSRSATYNTLAQLPPNKFINDQDKVLLTPEERQEALELLGCSSWKDIEPGTLQKEFWICRELTL